MEEKSPKYEFLEHTADIKIRVLGDTLNQIFENAVLAVSKYLAGNKKVLSKKGKVIEVKGEDMESLLYNFIDELLYLIDAESFIPVKAEVLIRGNNLKAEIYGDSTRNYSLDHIKSATYAEMSIKKLKSGWEAIFVLDV